MSMTRNNLPADMIKAIMERLPAKSLCRFKSVSKTWCSLISDPKLINNQLHLNNPHIPTKLILVSHSECLYSLDINKIRDNTSVTGDELIIQPLSILWAQNNFVGSCNGLVLVMDRNNRTLLLMNPTIREILELPFGPFLFGMCGEVLDEDMWGFGYDPSIDNYKVIYINLEDTSVTVFDLKSNAVRQLPNFSYDISIYSPPTYNCGVLINGYLHWLIDTLFIDYSPKIIAFSLTKEDFTEIEFPNSFGNYSDDNDVYYNLQVVDIGGKLGVFTNINDLWVMEEYGVRKSWTKISIRGEIGRIPVCSVDGNTRDIVFRDKNHVGIYNVDERAYRDVRILGCPDGFHIGGTYVESLVSPRCITKTAYSVSNYKTQP